MEAVRKFLARKNIVFSARRYFIDAMGAMAQGLFCTLLVGTILNTIGQQLHIGFLTEVIVTLGKGEGAVTYTIGGLCSAMVGPGMAVAIGRALEAPPLVLYSLIPVGFATNMFVQSLKFIEEHSENAFDISVYGSNYLETGKNEHGYKSDRKKLRK